jgi:uncharacterized protein YndB with AHSA1/START domain
MAFRIERELALDAALQDVWEAVIADGWLADEVRLDLRPGGDAYFHSEEEIKTGWVEEALAPSRLAFWWATDDQPASRVELTLQPDAAGGTRLRVVESRPLEVLDLVGIPLSGPGGASYGPALVAA